MYLRETTLVPYPDGGQVRERHARGKGRRAAGRDAEDDRSQGRLIKGGLRRGVPV